MGVEVEVAAPESLKTPLRFAPPTPDDPGAQPANNFEEQLRIARAAGFAAGRAEGIAEAISAEEQSRMRILERTAHHLVDAATSASELRAEILDEVVSDAVDLALELVNLLVDDRLAQSADPTRDAIVHALKLAPEGESLVVRVAPEASIDTSELLVLTRGTPIVIRPDPTIAVGDCIVQVGACQIEHQLEDALARVRVELERIRKTPEMDAS